jgi:hypothetical protein
MAPRNCLHPRGVEP